jgi:hypothetical protein
MLVTSWTIHRSPQTEDTDTDTDTHRCQTACVDVATAPERALAPAQESERATVWVPVQPTDVATETDKALDPAVTTDPADATRKADKSVLPTTR